jgi:glycerophosphoryl diester phosphodiesterase
MQMPFIWAHRGASGRAPENTMAAFLAAETDGADGIELDLHLSRDGVPMVIHDERLERTTNGTGLVAHRSLVELQRLDAGAWYGPTFAGERLPTLADVLAWASDRLRLNLEVKTAAAGRAVHSALADFPRCRVLISSFEHRMLTALRDLDPALPLGFLSDARFWRRGLARAAAARAESFHPRQDLISRQLVEACHRQGITVFPWTIDAPDRAATLLRLGVDGLFTNDPAGMQTLRTRECAWAKP